MFIRIFDTPVRLRCLLAGALLALVLPLEAFGQFPEPSPQQAPTIPVAIPFAVPTAAPVAVPAVAESNYPLSPDDMIHVKVFQEDDLESTLRIAKDGTITFPLIGLVHVGGESPQDAATAIRVLLEKDYLVSAQVSVTVMEYAKRRYTVLGQVQKPGSYELPDREGITLLEAIGMAGGYTRAADPAKITLKRRSAGKETIFRLNAKSMASGASSSSFEIEPEDVITVGESMF